MKKQVIICVLISAIGGGLSIIFTAVCIPWASWVSLTLLKNMVDLGVINERLGITERDRRAYLERKTGNSTWSYPIFPGVPNNEGEKK